ncbi:hypothetical protein LEM8419_02586 [Neolewinella maritima]|uniref:PKD domain-containing protein n=1 Tax=Neolewinella maritima TaxID=1383882 RepID=A0ABN8F8V8_9BACT|nr:PKD domain-containing protein [Neolewinella maritima]CAH1001680.1 hypothetical protein LEM8419_02586 [Neolewinella maritima]
MNNLLQFIALPRRGAPVMRFLLFALLCFSMSLQASHFRYGSMSWRHISGTTVEFKIQEAWRASAFFSGIPSVGAEATVDLLQFGDGTSESVRVTVTSVDAADDWFFGETTITHTYPANMAYTPFLSGCCRIAGISNAAGSRYVLNQVDLSPGVLGNDSPVTALSPIVNVAMGASATFNVPATDPDGDPIQYRLPTTGEFQGINLTPLSITPQGVATITLNNAPAGSLFAMPVIVEDLDGSGNVKSATMVDFLIRVVMPSAPPVFDYTVTPADNFIFFVSPGQAVNFDIKASDPDPGSTVTLNAVGVPVGAVFTPGLPVSAETPQSSFSWTPQLANIGTNVINITARDDLGNQTATAVSIVVSQRPVFDVPPTPDATVHQVVAPGDLLTFTVQASDADPADQVQIISATQKDSGDDFTTLGATFAPPLPTPAGNPTSTVFSWTPAPTDWGMQHAVFTAEDLTAETATYEVPILVNTTPQFTSTPVLTAVSTFNYVYNITATDDDLPYGDALMLVAVSIPPWLTLTDNGDGTGQLSGTPLPGDEGTYTIELQAQDIHHHQNPGGIPTQTFQLVVTSDGGGGGGGGDTTCTLSIDPPTVTDVSCLATSDGSIQVTVSGAVGNVSYDLTGPTNQSNTTGVFTGLPDGMYTVTATDDGVAGCTATESGIMVGTGGGGAAPVITNIDVPTTVQLIGQILKAYVDYTDADDNDNHTATIDWGDGFSELMSIDQLTNEADAQHRYFAPGSYQVTITLEDGCGNVVTQQASNLIVVSNCPVAKAAPVITNIDVPTTVQLIGQILKAYVDYTDADDQDDHTATIDWGDGFSELMSIDQLTNEADAQHRYFAPGSYQVTVTIKDGCGGTTTMMAPNLIEVGNCSINNAAPVITAIDVPTTVQDIGQILKAYVDYTDADDTDDHTATIDWGDGFSELMSIDQLTNEADAQHRYFAAGSYQVSVTIDDGCGGTTTMMAPNLIEVSKCSVANAAPVITNIDVPTTVQDIGQILKAYVDYTDADDQDDHMAKIDWGDGYSEMMSVKQLTNKADAQHRYFAAGRYRVTITLKDSCGGMVTKMADNRIEVGAVSVSAPPAAPTVINLEGAAAAGRIDALVYPNPASHELRVEWTGFEGELRVALMDQVGRRVIEQRVAAEAANLRMDLTALQLAPGAYLLQLTDGDTRLNRMVLIQ